MRTITVFALLLMTGCAARTPHVKITQAPTRICQPNEKPSAENPCLGEQSWQCDGQGQCELVRSWQPSQLSPVGCWIHEAITWHVPMECK